MRLTPEPRGPSAPVSVTRTAVRHAAPEPESLLDLPWLALRRAAVAAVVVATFGWVAALVWAPVRDSDLAQAAWAQSVSETWNME